MGVPDPFAAVEIVEEIMTQHWRPDHCKCWVCVEGRKHGLGARSRYMRHLRTSPERAYVHVDATINKPFTIPVINRYRRQSDL